MIVTIDGPAASGKSTAARLLAERLGYYYLCSGLLYRAVGYILTNVYGYTLDTINTIAVADIEQCIDSRRLSYRYSVETRERIFFDEKDITFNLKSSIIDKVSSIISTNIHVREAIASIQYAIVMNHSVVADGRDVGSSVFPNAQVKFFFTAALEVRALRWRSDQLKRGEVFSMKDAIKYIEDRDNRDIGRSIAPLIVTRGTEIIDTSTLTIDQVVDIMIKRVTDYVKMNA